jgi:hypothetical protein
VLDAGRGHAAPDLVTLAGRAPQGLLAEDVLSGLGRGDRRLRVERVRPTVVEQSDLRVGDEVMPVGVEALVAVP